MYKMTMVLTAEEFIEMVQQRLGPNNNLKVEKIIDKTDKADEARLDPSAMRAPRGKRKSKSKVVETILSVLQDGSAGAGTLRTALAARGLSGSSLSTGLAVLQKRGQIKRSDGGDYYLVVKEAAE
jgi:hypothetical protein